MFEFEPAPQFRPAFERYPETWQIISSPHACLLMREMAHVGQPAVDTLHHLPDLCRLIHYVDTRDSDFWGRAVRKLIGHMCRRVMERLGYRLYRERVSTELSTIFTRGAVYRWVDEI